MISPINSKAYDALKYFAMVVLPALGALYFAMAGIWGLPAAEQVMGTIVAADTFLGVVLHLSSTAYAKSDERFDGEINVDESPEKKQFSLDLKDMHPDEIQEKDQLVFKVNKESA